MAEGASLVLGSYLIKNKGTTGFYKLSVSLTPVVVPEVSVVE